jgi:hypothetical protein
MYHIFRKCTKVQNSVVTNSTFGFWAHGEFKGVLKTAQNYNIPEKRGADLLKL